MLCVSLLSSLTQFVLPRLSAVRGEFQPQLFVLELLEAQYDGLLVDAGLPAAGNQPNAHHLLLHTPHQLRCAHGSRGREGRDATNTSVLDVNN